MHILNVITVKIFILTLTFALIGAVKQRDFTWFHSRNQMFRLRL